MQNPPVICAAARTAIGAFNGSLSTVPAGELGAPVVRTAMERAKITPEMADEVILGSVPQEGNGRNVTPAHPSRQEFRRPFPP